MRHIGPGGISLPSAERLTRALRARRERGERRGRARIYDEDEVRDMIYGWHSGTVEPRIDQIHDYRVSAGFGVRFTVPMLGPVPIALDFGFPIVKGPGDREQVFNFWLGFFR